MIQLSPPINQLFSLTYTSPQAPSNTFIPDPKSNFTCLKKSILIKIQWIININLELSFRLGFYYFVLNFPFFLIIYNFLLFLIIYKRNSCFFLLWRWLRIWCKKWLLMNLFILFFNLLNHIKYKAIIFKHCVKKVIFIDFSFSFCNFQLFGY